MSRGKRYDDEPKLNMKKVLAVGLAFAVIVMIIALMINYPKLKDKAQGKNVATSYIAVNTNDKWGVINSKGDIVIEPTYEEMILIPDSSKAIFIVQQDVDFENETYTSYAIDDKGEKLFKDYSQVEAIQNIDKDGNVFFDTNVLKVQKDGKYGLINFSGKALTETEYSSIVPLENVAKSYITEKDGKKGLVDNSGSVIIENEYTEIKGLTEKYEDGYIVRNSNGYGLINYSKKQVLECKYDDIKNVCGSNMYVVIEGQDIELITSEGEVKLKNAFTEAVSIDNSNIITKSNGKYGLISSQGTKLLSNDYDELKYIFDDNYIAKKNDKYGIITINGNTQLDFQYDFISYMSEEGFIEAEKENGESDLLNTLFEIKTTGIVSEINTKLGYIKVRKSGEYKYYNFKLEEKDVKDVLTANTLFLSKKDNKYGYVDKNGIVIVDYFYDDATEQNDYGYSAVKINGKWGAIDSTGKVVVEPKYEFAQNTVISFINKWHLAPDLNANYYTDTDE